MKNDVAVYLSSTNYRNYSSLRKKQALLAFAAGARRVGANVEIVKELKVVPAKLAVILGWYSPHSNQAGVNGLRKQVIEFQRANGNKIMPIDAGCWKYADTENTYLRYSLDGVFYDQAFYANENSTRDRFDKIAKKINLTLKPWKNKNEGEYILLLLQRDSGWSMKGLSPVDWATSKIHQIRSLSPKPIMIRPHPAVPITIDQRKKLAKFKHVLISDLRRKTLQQDIASASMAMNFNSSSGVAAIMEGVPLFVDDKSSVCYKVANTHLDRLKIDIEYPDREQWLYDLAECHWSDGESFLGELYLKFKPFL